MSSHCIPGLSLSEGKAYCFQMDLEGKKTHAFVLLHKGEYHAYVNRCAHIPVPLDYDDGDFLDERIGLIACKLHGALFEPSTGFCVAGPCSGDSLQKLNLRFEGPDCYIEAP